MTTTPDDSWKTTWSCASMTGSSPRRGVSMRSARKVSRHPQVNEQRLVGAQIDQQILAAPGDRSDRLTGQTRDEIPGKRAAEVRTTLVDAIDTGAAHRSLEQATYGFDLREFRHTGIVSQSFALLSARFSVRVRVQVRRAR